MVGLMTWSEEFPQDQWPKNLTFLYEDTLLVFVEATIWRYLLLVATQNLSSINILYWEVFIDVGYGKKCLKTL